VTNFSPIIAMNHRIWIKFSPMTSTASNLACRNR